MALIELRSEWDLLLKAFAGHGFGKKSKAEKWIPKNNLCCLQKKLEKNLNFFQQANCPNILEKVIKLFTEKKSSKSFLTKSSYRDHVLHLLALN